jgi:hypothetical protein
VATEDAKMQSFAVKLDFQTPESITTRLANHVIVQGEQNGWFLSFFEAVPPMLLGSSEEVARQMENVQSVQAVCVARIFLPAGRVQDFVSAIQSVSQQFAAAVTKGEIQ